jgi:hypothetical protein
MGEKMNNDHHQKINDPHWMIEDHHWILKTMHGYKDPDDIADMAIAVLVFVGWLVVVVLAIGGWL